MAAAATQIQANETGALRLLCAKEEGTGAAGAAQVKARAGAEGTRRFVVVLAASGALRSALRRELPRPVGKNRVLVDTAPRRKGDVDLARLAERSWFYRRLGATHLVIEAEPARGVEIREYLTQLLSAFGPLVTDEALQIDVVLPARAAAVVHNEWMLSFLCEEAIQRARREFDCGRIQVEGRVQVKQNEGFSLSAEGAQSESELASARLPLRVATGQAAAARSARLPAGESVSQLGLL